MKRLAKLIIAMAAFAALTACTGSSIRYSPYELDQFPPDVREHIKSSEVSLGMNQQAVRYSWGAPNAVKVREPDAGAKSTEEWVYLKMRIYATRLIFTDGHLTGIISGSAKTKPLSSLKFGPDKDEKTTRGK